MSEKIWSKEALELVNKQLNEIRNEVIFETKSGKKYHIKENDNAYICSRAKQHIVIPKIWLHSFQTLSLAVALDVVLSAMENEYYVAAKQPFGKAKSVPVYGDTKDGCERWMENQIGDWELIHHTPIF